MRKFSVGDRIRCIDPSSSLGSLELHKEYVIVEVASDLICFKEGGAYWSENRFELVKGLETMADKELADKYRELREEAYNIAQELEGRGFKMLYSGNAYGVSHPSRAKGGFTFKKTITETVEV